jgi:predicted DNA-binding protein (MmcQ/YjbR family)
MTVEELRRCFLCFPEVTEETPFDAITAVYKTAGKMFALINWEGKPLTMNLKCEPTKAEALRDQYACVGPGYHMSKKHWNTVTIDGSVPDDLLRDWISHSFEQVIAGMPRKQQAELRMKWESGEAVSVSIKDEALREDLKKRI